MLILACLVGLVLGAPSVTTRDNVTYNGIIRNDLDVFLGIKYARDTSGENRFRPPTPYKPTDTVIDATQYGFACPQPLGANSIPLLWTNITEYSEDCLNLNIVRPSGCSKLPVLVWLHGGSFFFNSNQEITSQPDGLILQSVENETPIVHVSINYRLGVFGFAQSAALKADKSENAGLRDQRLALEWIRDNIEAFGGDPEKITLHGQSSGGAAVGIQTLAYGGESVPFQQAIYQSQALEIGMNDNCTEIQMKAVVDAAGCEYDVHSAEAIACLRSLDTKSLAEISFKTYSEAKSTGEGDCWLPVVDGDFLPDAPSKLIEQVRFANIATMIMWSEDDTDLYADPTIQTEEDTYAFMADFLAGFNDESLVEMLALYPSTDFPDNASANLTKEFYRTARILRDVVMVCPPMNYGQHLHEAGNPVYYIVHNQTLFSPMFETIGLPGLGVVHTSESAYVFGNLSHYDQGEFPFNPSQEDYRLEREEGGSWAAFVSTGKPSNGVGTLRGIQEAYAHKNEVAVFVAGGSSEGLSNIDGNGASPALVEQKLRERCAFWNSPAIIEQLLY